MVQAIDQAERERELTKQSLAGNLDRLEARVRAELDWKARLRRDGPRYALVGGVVVAAAVGAIVLRRLVRGDRTEPEPRPATSMAEMAAELAAIRKRLDGAKLEADTGPAWQKLALRAVSAAAAAGGTYAARRFMARSGADPAAPTGPG
ncbi:MAG TPA: hypothetical protein VG520_07165 [Candidatus Dormibacteraeota bacterium]|nr:hypothetical protein [Candidatus Dormibacteraeota bacterium]